MKTALITGITGQDGSFLAEFLIEKGYQLHGTIRRSYVDFRERIAHLEGHPQFHLHYADLGDSMSIKQIVSKMRPDKISNLAAQSHVQVSIDSPEFTPCWRGHPIEWRPKPRKKLGWDTSKMTSFEQLVNLMVDADMAKVAVERAGEQVKMNLEEYLENGIVK